MPKLTDVNESARGLLEHYGAQGMALVAVPAELVDRSEAGEANLDGVDVAFRWAPGHGDDRLFASLVIDARPVDEREAPPAKSKSSPRRSRKPPA